jgi:hypothetical protein
VFTPKVTEITRAGQPHIAVAACAAGAAGAGRVPASASGRAPAVQLAPDGDERGRQVLEEPGEGELGLRLPGDEGAVEGCEREPREVIGGCARGVDPNTSCICSRSPLKISSPSGSATTSSSRPTASETPRSAA